MVNFSLGLEAKILASSGLKAKILASTSASGRGQYFCLGRTQCYKAEADAEVAANMWASRPRQRPRFFLLYIIHYLTDVTMTLLAASNVLNRFTQYIF